MASRYITNDFAAPLAVSNTEPYFKAALEEIVAHFPPRESYPSDVLKGLWSGPTGIAYLFLHVSVIRPKLLIAGRPAIRWAQDYIRGSRGRVRLEPQRCGVGSEKLSFEAVRATVTKDLGHVKEFVANIQDVLAGSFPDELLYGRAGTLYFLRMIRHWVPNSAPLVEKSIVLLTEKLMAEAGRWNWHDDRYLGAVHGDIAIITQLVLTTPPLAPQLKDALQRLLSWQLDDGNWPTQEGKDSSSLVQFCHGAPGIVLSLLSLRPYFPSLEAEIDVAIQKGRECVWKYGILRKEPSLCHGIFGNSLIFPPGQQRDHFLALATPKKVEELRIEDETVFEPADYGQKYATLMNYSPSAAWTWMVYGKTSPKMIVYNDI